ncbi:MAG: NUDIX hydrolase [Phycisphaerales bacterium]|nr:NUDIX hydrolase [Planctomycetota bacterium]MCH8509401.1 NUDIX hydrolase [Phycisphaerales bacterium]
MTGCRIEPVTGPLTVRVLREPVPRTPEQARAIDDAWGALCAANPRYFNGRILSFESYDPAAGAATARDEEYRAHAVKRTVDLGLSFFGITGILCVRGDDGRDRVMLARRGDSVHDYPGMWEFGPCGGIDPPGSGDRLTPDDLAAELTREAAEELGLDLSGATLTHLALVHDTPDIGSTDLMVLARLPSMPETDGVNWEVSGTRWATLNELTAWCERRPGEVIPTTRAMAAWLASRPHTLRA